MVEQFTVSRDDRIYEHGPDVTLTASGRLVCSFIEHVHHVDRTYSRNVVVTSDDRGRTWSEKKQLNEPIYIEDENDSWWNNARISTLNDDRLVVANERLAKFQNMQEPYSEASNWLWFSDDEGKSWDGPYETPVKGHGVDQLIELQHGEHAGRWLLTATTTTHDSTEWHVQTWISDNKGDSWHGPYTVGHEPDHELFGNLQLHEVSVLELPTGDLVAFFRESSGRGLDCFKAISEDGGETWDGVYRMPIPACHRPVAGMLESGDVMITYRLMQGGDRWLGWWTQNTFAVLTDVESCLARSREEAHTRIMPLDYDRSPKADSAYTGWVQFDDGEIYVVNYTVDDAPPRTAREEALGIGTEFAPKGYENVSGLKKGIYEPYARRAFIRGYAFHEDEFVLNREELHSEEAYIDSTGGRREEEFEDQDD